MDLCMSCTRCNVGPALAIAASDAAPCHPDLRAVSVPCCWLIRSLSPIADWPSAAPDCVNPSGWAASTCGIVTSAIGCLQFDSFGDLPQSLAELAVGLLIALCCRRQPLSMRCQVGADGGGRFVEYRSHDVARLAADQPRHRLYGTHDRLSGVDTGNVRADLGLRLRGSV